MIVWLDNHLSPALARWIEEEFGAQSVQIRELGLARASDPVIFAAAGKAGAIFMTKDRDFAELVDRLGAPPAIILLTCGNTSTAHLRVLLKDRLALAMTMINSGESLVEIGGDA